MRPMSNPPPSSSSTSRPQTRGSSVRGPTSALTSFLQEQGISARDIAARYRRRQEEAAALTANQEPGSASTIHDPNTIDGTPPAVGVGNLSNLESVGSSSSATGSAAAISISPNSHEVPDIVVPNPSVTQGTTGRKPRKRKPNRDSSDDDMDAQFGGPFQGKLRSKPNLVCVGCRRPILPSTAAPLSFASMCQACLNQRSESGPSPKGRTKRRIGRARETAAEFALVRDDQDLYLAQSTVPTLVDMCIKNLMEYLDAIEEIGELSTATMRKFARVICKKRQLNGEILHLFTGMHVTSLTLYDVTLLDAQTLGSLAFMCPNLKQLSLAFCGRATDETVQSWINANSWYQLNEITIKGPYLVRDTLWSEFLGKFGGQFTKIHLEYCAKLSVSGIEALLAAQQATNYPLEDLALHFADSLTSETLDLLREFRNLQGLSLMHSCANLTDVHIDAITRSMTSLRAIALGTAPKLTDKSLFSLRRIQASLAHITLASVEGITTPGVLAWLGGYWPPKRGRSVLEMDSDNEPEVELHMVNANGEEALPVLSTEEEEHWAQVDLLPAELDFTEITQSHRDCKPIHPLVLETFVLERCRGFNSDQAMIPLLSRIATDVRRLALNWADQLTTQAFLAYFDHAGLHPSLIDLDVSWVRCVDDAILEAIVDKMPDVERVVLFGCNKITEWAAHKVWINARGRQISIVGSEYYQA